MKKLKLDELNRVDVDTFKNQQKFPVVLVLDNIRSALNVGSLFRTADAFGLEQVHLCGITARPPHREIMKTALGSTDSVQWQGFDHVEDCIQYLKNESYTIAVVEQTDASLDLSSFDWSSANKWALILGNEVDGVSQAFIDAASVAIEIVQFGTKHSLNVAVCGGIVSFSAVQAIEKIYLDKKV